MPRAREGRCRGAPSRSRPIGGGGGGDGPALRRVGVRPPYRQRKARCRYQRAGGGGSRQRRWGASGGARLAAPATGTLGGARVTPPWTPARHSRARPWAPSVWGGRQAAGGRCRGCRPPADSRFVARGPQRVPAAGAGRKKKQTKRDQQPQAVRLTTSAVSLMNAYSLLRCKPRLTSPAPHRGRLVPVCCGIGRWQEGAPPHLGGGLIWYDRASDAVDPTNVLLVVLAALPQRCQYRRSIV